MKRAAYAVLALATIAIVAADAQVNPTNLPSNTVLGRLGTGTGPAQAIPFATLGAQLNSNAAISGTGDVTLSGTVGAITSVLNNIPNDTTLALDILATNAVAPSTPASGKTRIYVDSTQKVLSAKNDAGTVSVTVVPNVASSFQFLTGITSGGVPQTATIDGQVNNASPPSTGEVMLWNPNTVQWEKTTIANIGSSSGVASVGGQTGALTLGAGLTNSTTTLLVDPSYMQGFIGGLVMSNDGSTPNTVIDSSAGVATSDDATTLMKIAAFTKNTNAAWAVGTSNGCLDSGTGLIASTWYHLYVVERTDTGVVDELCSMAPPSLTETLTSISNASPGVVTLVGHGLQPGQPVKFTTTGGLPTGLTVGTQYYVLAAGFSSSAFEVSATCGGTGCTTGTAVNTSSAGSGTHSVVTTAILPASYTKQRRIGSFKTDGSVHILGFKQNNDEFQLLVGILDISSVTPSTTATLYPLSVPPGVKVTARGRLNWASGTAAFALFDSPDETSIAGGSLPTGNYSIAVPANIAFPSAVSMDVRTNTSQQIRGVSTAANGTVNWVTYGWYDSRGKSN